MPRKVVDFLTDFAISKGFEVYDSLFGSILIGQTPSILQSSGAVYGIWVNSDAAPSENISAIQGYPDWYPIYWGKDISPVSRMKAHVQGHANGNIDLPNVVEVQGKPLIYGAILVSDYVGFEELLHEEYRPLKGSSATGKVGTVIRVEN